MILIDNILSILHNRNLIYYLRVLNLFHNVFHIKSLSKSRKSIIYEAFCFLSDGFKEIHTH